MSDDFDALRAAWTADPGLEGEVERSRLLWRRAVRRMWFWNVVDAALLLLVTVQLAVSLMGGATWQSIALAVLVFAILLWFLRKRYLSRSAELGSPDTERLSVLGAAIRGVRVRLIRNSLALATAIPLFGLGVLFGRMQRTARSGQGSADPASLSWLSLPIVKWIAVLIAVLIVARLVQVVLRDRRALSHLTSRMEEYEVEYQRDATPPGSAAKI